MDLFNKNRVEELEAKVSQLEILNTNLSKYGAMDAIKIQSEIARLQGQKAGLEHDLTEINRQINSAHNDLVQTEDLLILQEVGIYQFSEILDTAVAYKEKIKEIDERIKDANRPGGGAITARQGWTVNGSAREGQHMISETSKLMLRAYNSEVEDAIRTLKPFKVDAAIDRLNKVRNTIAKLGSTMQMQISISYHDLRLRELKLTGDFLQKQAEEKERQKDIARQLKDEAKAQAEFEAEKAKHLKDLAHNETILKKAEESGNVVAAEETKARIEEIHAAIAGVEERAANIRQGYVYVISNIGSFGEGVIKIGLTRRLDYEDRIHELSDASVPFIFDIHAVIASTDAVTLERRLHDELEEFRLNRVNARKEFFRATPVMVKEKLEHLAGEHLLVFNEIAAAEEYRISIGTSEASRT